MENVSYDVKRTFDLLELYKNDYKEKEDALGGKELGDWHTYSAKEYVQNTNNISYGLLSLGLKKGDVVATISNNRPEWNFVDLGLAQTGTVHLPIYPTLGIDDYEYILNHSEAKFVVVSDKSLFDKISPLVDKVESLKEVFSFDRLDNVRHWTDLSRLGEEYNRKKELTVIKESITENDLATLIYTSGTTGTPKGVMLSHKNLVSNFTQHSKNHELGQESKGLSFLPLCHILERTLNYHYQYKGMSVYYVASLAGILPALKEIKPQLFSTVPRLLERIYDGIMNKGNELTGIKHALFFWAVRLGDTFDYGKKFSWWYNKQRKIADKLIYSKWRAVMGDDIKIIISGGAALQPRIGRVLGVAGIITLEGYGLTETSPVIAVSNVTTMEIRVGTVGPVLPGIEMKIANDGEIICKGPNVMMGYYKAPESTKEIIDENGYLHTGDIGELVEGKYLKITDRKKEIFKLSSGKYIAPQMIENKIKESIFIEQAMVIGANEKFASALIVPNFQYIERWCEQNNISLTEKESMLNNKEVIKAIQLEVKGINKKLGTHEEIKRYRLIKDEWTPETGELSPTLKLKRKVLSAKYSEIIKEIFLA
ncbi:MAG: long-chain fatty acid--CoA ligase [Prolixibacteraceae bacterium]|jgi:long-chain acyl-CoA synthetase|nr:long-chain fatty acid--CoA ligase [Prolixibacteraceae bacterium]